MAVLALGLVGAGLTSAIGIGASIGWMGGVVLGNLLFGSNKGQNAEGSRLSDLSVQSSTYGGTIQLVYGTMRASGNVIWSTPLKETRHVSRQSGGKGGGGSATTTTYTYSVSFAVGLCAGPVSTVRRVWADTKLIYDATASNTQATEKYPGVIRIHTGGEDQQPDSTMEMHLGAGAVPAYRGLCYLTFTDLQLADFANRIPNISAEIVSSGDMDCDAVILPKIPSMYRDGGVIDPARGALLCMNATRAFKYDLVNNTLALNVPLVNDVYGDLCGLDSEGYLYHATDAYGVGMHLCKRNPNTLAVVAKTKKRIDYSVSGFVLGDRIFVHRSRKIYDLDFNLVADLSEWFPSANEAPMCADADGRYWQAAVDIIRRVEVDIVACQAVAEDEIAYSSAAKGASVALPLAIIPIATPISALVMDLPMLRAEDDGLGLYYAFGIKDAGGASLYRSPDGVTWDIIGTGSEVPTYGWASNVLAAPLSPWSWDETNKVQISLSSGALDSKTALEVLNWANVALLGNEIIQWRNATLLAANLYELSGLLRGRRGTEGSVGTHAIGDKLVVLAAGSLYRMAMASTQIGQTAHYKALPAGGDWDDAAQTSLKYNAASLRCFSPVHVKGTRDASGNLTLKWVRRTRWNAEWLDEIDIPLFEDEEAYQIDILNGSTVVRTISASTTSATYSAANQTADFGAAQSVLSVAIYQINSTIGRGTPGKATV